MKFKTLQQPKLFEVYESIEAQTPRDSRMKLVGALVDKVDLRAVYATYREGGCPPYDPRAMLKAVIFAFINNIYSSRRIAGCMEYDERYRWLAGGYKPSYRTILRFLSDHMEGSLAQVFSDIVLMLVDRGYVDVATVYVDGTTVESRGSRYSIVWRKSVARRAAANTEKVKALIEQIFDDVSSQAAGIDTSTIGEALSDSDIAACVEALGSAKGRGAKAKDAKELEERLERASGYNRQLEAMGERNSLSKTDATAIGMHPKDDTTRKGPCLAMHNLQIATSFQFVVGFGLFSRASDTKTLPPFLEMLAGGVDPDAGASYNCRGALKRLVCDAGYGSLENVEACDRHGIEPFLKYAGYDSPGRNPYHIESMPYSPEEDCYLCPNGRKLRLVCRSQTQGEGGRKRTLLTYRCEGCSGCPLREKCIKGDAASRESEVTLQWREARARLKANLDSPEGVELRKKRSAEPESVFGIMKWDHAYRRFRHFRRRGIIADLMLLFISHNIAKAAALGLGWEDFGAGSPSSGSCGLNFTLHGAFTAQNAA